MIFLLLSILFMSLCAGWRAWQRIRYFLHVYQLESYKPRRYVRWLLNKSGNRILGVSHGIGLLLLGVVWWGYVQGGTTWVVSVSLLLWGMVFSSFRLYRGAQQKKPLAFTSRMRRLVASAVGLGSIVLLSTLVISVPIGSRITLLNYMAGFWVVDLCAPLLVYIAALAMIPVERQVQEGYKRQARRKLSGMDGLITVGITGSYGKTSVKFIVAEILKQRFNTLATPGSYNTPMGICIVVNNHLTPAHQVLVLEMGMRYRGDIRELCGIARPDISIVTDVGVAHLETMGSIENIALEKGDIVGCLDKEGVAILNMDNPYVAAMAKRAPGKVWTVSATGNVQADIVAQNITYGSNGAQFDVEHDGNAMTFTTRLLGKHNVLNILLGVAIGRHMGLNLRQISRAVARIEPVEHRLQLLNKGAITVIDDAFNSNPVGARNAVEVLGAFRTGRRVIVTPGMVELGERQAEENRVLGEHIAQHVDLAVLIGEAQTTPIVEGLKSQQFPESQTKVFPSFFEAQSFLQGYLKDGDVVLYENDLPDQYNE